MANYQISAHYLQQLGLVTAGVALAACAARRRRRSGRKQWRRRQPDPGKECPWRATWRNAHPGESYRAGSASRSF